MFYAGGIASVENWLQGAKVETRYLVGHHVGMTFVLCKVMA